MLCTRRGSSPALAPTHPPTHTPTCPPTHPPYTQEEVKAQIALSPATHYRGWQRMGTNVTRFDGGYQRDWHEAIDLYKEVTQVCFCDNSV